MTRETVIRLAILYTPILAAAILWRWRRPARRLGAGVLLAVGWNAWSLVAVNVIAEHMRWWSYRADGPDLLGMPADVLVGWSVWWGVVAVLVPLRLPWVVGAAAAVDVVAMSTAAPVVSLGPLWLVGEALALAVCLIPGLLLAHWTEEDSNLSPRIVLQIVGATGVMVGLVLALGAELRGLDLRHVMERPTSVTAALSGVLATFAVLAVTAVREFGERGLGTPIPLDPPRRLVTSGPYAYVRNPMQVGMLGMYACLAAILWVPWLLVAVTIGAAYSAGLASWHEDDELTERFGERWTAYRRTVRPWVVRWRPAPQEAAARVYVAVTCVACSSLGSFLAARKPLSLEVLAAEESPQLRCERLTYIGPDGYRRVGIAALGRALEHINLGWALAGWLIRLPVLCSLVQLIGDAAGAGPRAAWKVGIVPASDRCVVSRGDQRAHLGKHHG